jgi:hypothetical protein
MFSPSEFATNVLVAVLPDTLVGWVVTLASCVAGLLSLALAIWNRHRAPSKASLVCDSILTAILMYAWLKPPELHTVAAPAILFAASALVELYQHVRHRRRAFTLSVYHLDVLGALEAGDTGPHSIAVTTGWPKPTVKRALEDLRDRAGRVTETAPAHWELVTLPAAPLPVRPVQLSGTHAQTQENVPLTDLHRAVLTAMSQENTALADIAAAANMGRHTVLRILAELRYRHGLVTTTDHGEWRLTQPAPADHPVPANH